MAVMSTIALKVPYLGTIIIDAAPVVVAPRAARRAHFVDDSAKHMSYKFPRHPGEYAGMGRTHAGRCGDAAARAAVALADVEYALALADAATLAASYARAADPLAYSSDHGYIA